MKELLVRIGDYAIPPTSFEAGVFKFPTAKDEKMFYEIFPEIEKVVETTFNRRPSFQYYRAWQTLTKLGWVHDGSDNGFLRWLYPETAVEKLELALKHHDWTYMMSDDYRWFSSGQAEHDRIIQLMKEVGEPLASEMYHKYAR